MRTRYFVRRPRSEPLYVFRILPDVRVQIYDVAGHAWLPAPLEPLYRWAVIDPGMDIDEIDEAWARLIIDHFHRRLPRPTWTPGTIRSVFDPGADTPQFRLIE